MTNSSQAFSGAVGAPQGNWKRAIVIGLALGAIPLAIILILLAWSNALHPVIAHALTIATIIAGVVVALHQQGEQHQSALRLQAEQHRTALKLQIYERLAGLIQAAQEANSKRRTSAAWAVSQIEMRAHDAEVGLPPSRNRYRHVDLLDNESNASQAVVQLIIQLESWELALPGSVLFRRALSCAQFNLLESQHEYFRLTVRLLPLELGPEHGSIVTDPIGTTSDLDELSSARDRYLNDMDDLSGWLHDISVEGQLALLGGLFPGTIARRAPLDPSVVVLDSRREAELVKYFENDTAQARSHAETIREATEALGAAKVANSK